MQPAKKKAKQKIGYRETKARQRQTTERNILFEPNDEEFILTMKAARGKLEVTKPAALPYNMPMKSSGGTHRNIGNRKTKYVCVFDADESTRPRPEGAGHKPQSRSYHCKSDEFYDSPQSCSQIHSDASSRKIPDAKAAVEKGWEKLEKIPAWQLRISAEKIHFAFIDGSLSS